MIVPEGKIATGKLAQALMHGARVIALRGNFDEALKLVRELADRHPIALVNSVNEFRIEGQKTAAFELVEALDTELDALCIPVGNAGNITAYWRGFLEVGMQPRMLGFQAAGRRAAGARRAGGAPGDDRQRDPDRQPGALGAGDGRDDLLGRRGRGGHRRADPRRLPVPRRRGGRLLRAGVGGQRRRAAGPRRRDARRIVCVLTGHGLKDPDTALDAGRRA